MPGSFFDTNVVLYLASGDPVKAGQAEAVLSGGGSVSVQVLNEITNVCRRRLQWTWAETRHFLSIVRSVVATVPVSVEIHEAGLRLAERYQLSLYDAMVVAAALTHDCDTLWSEDMGDGLVVDGRVQIIDPFRGV